MSQVDFILLVSRVMKNHCICIKTKTEWSALHSLLLTNKPTFFFFLSFFANPQSDVMVSILTLVTQGVCVWGGGGKKRAATFISFSCYNSCQL